MSKMWLTIAIGLLLLAIAAIGLSEDTADITKKETTPYYPPVSVLEVVPKDHAGVITVFAEITPRWSASLKAHIGGEIIKVTNQALAGQAVAQEDLLIRIEESGYQANLASTRQSVAEARLALQLEQKKTDQAQADWKRSGIKDKPSDLALNLPQLQIAKQRLRTAQSALKAAEKDLEYTKIRAPFSGFVTHRHVSYGQTVSEGDLLLDIIDSTRLDITVSLSQKQWDLLQKTGWEEHPATVLDASGQKIASATIVRGGGYLDPETRQYRLFLEITPDSHNRALSGEFVHVNLPGNVVKSALKIPESALTREGEVWLIDADGRLQRFYPTILFRQDKWLVIRPSEQNLSTTVWKIATNPLASFLPGNRVQPISVKAD